MEIVEIRNEWDRPITIPHNGAIYTIDPGASKIVPFDAAASIFGHPAARDDAKVKGRRELYDHVRGMWNFYLGWDTELTWENDKCPRFSAVDVNSQEPIHFVIHDPDGAKAFNLTPSIDTTDQALLSATLLRLQAQVEQLNARLLVQDESAIASAAPSPEILEPNENVNGEIPVGAELPPTPKVDDTPVKKDGPRIPPTSNR